MRIDSALGPEQDLFGSTAALGLDPERGLWTIAGNPGSYRVVEVNPNSAQAVWSPCRRFDWRTCKTSDVVGHVDKPSQPAICLLRVTVTRGKLLIQPTVVTSHQGSTVHPNLICEIAYLEWISSFLKPLHSTKTARDKYEDHLTIMTIITCTSEKEDSLNTWTCRVVPSLTSIKYMPKRLRGAPGLL